MTPTRADQVDRLEGTKVGHRLPRSPGSLEKQQRHGGEETGHQKPHRMERRRPPCSPAERHTSARAPARGVVGGGQPHAVRNLDLGTWCQQDASPESLGAPTKVEIGADIAKELIPPAEIGHQTGLHERPGGRDREDVSPLVELTLVLRARGGIVDDATR